MTLDPLSSLNFVLSNVWTWYKITCNGLLRDSKFGSFASDIKEYFIYDVTLDFKDMVQQQKWTANLHLVCIAFGSTERGEDD